MGRARKAAAERSVVVSITLPPGHAAAIDVYAQGRGMSRSEVVRKLIERAGLVEAVRPLERAEVTPHPKAKK